MALRAWMVVVVMCSVAAAQSDEAKRHYEAGRALYEVRKFQEAMEEFQTAKRLLASPAFDYNIARCLERMQRWHEAAEAYRRYLPTASESEQVELQAHIDELAEHERELTRPPPAKPKPIYRKAWFWGAVGGAAAVVVVGVALGATLGTRDDPAHAIMGVTFR